jgi:LPXTG-site transpeptidase (sortase) family protein
MLGVTVGKELYERFVCLLTVMAEQLTALISGAGRRRPDTALLVTSRREAGPGEHRREPVEGPGLDRVDRRGVVAVSHRRYRVDERLPREERARPPVGGSAPHDHTEYRLVGQILGIVAVLALSFLIELTVLGGLRHDRDQARLAALFRLELAQGKDAQGQDLVAPVGPFDDAGLPLAAGAPVALLEIPRLSLREVVVEGTTSGTLMSGPGHRRDTPLPGQAGTSVIAGRRATYGGPFGSIGELSAGDHIFVTTGQGKSSFTVLGVRRAGDPIPPALTRGHGRLTLVTTDGPALAPIDALRVDADLVSETQPRPPQLPSRALPPADAIMAGDTSALWGVVGWSILLVGAAIATVWVRFRTGLWPAWVIGVPVLVTLGLFAADDIAAMLPNVL